MLPRAGIPIAVEEHAHSTNDPGLSLASENGLCDFGTGITMATPRKPDQSVQAYSLPPRNRSIPVVQGNDCVVALRALGEDTRVRIIGLLVDEALDVGEISKRLGVSQYNVSKHLRILREAGLLEVEKHGRTHLYALPEAILRDAADSVLDLGCCSFQFNGPPAGADKLAAAPRRRRAAKSVAPPRAAKPRRV